MALDSASAEAMPQSYIGSRICLISKSEIRYEGILYTIDMKESTIALQHGALYWFYILMSKAGIVCGADTLLMGFECLGVQSGLMVLKGERKTGLKSLPVRKLLSTSSFEVSGAPVGPGSVDSRKSNLASSDVAPDVLRIAAEELCGFYGVWITVISSAALELRCSGSAPL